MLLNYIYVSNTGIKRNSNEDFAKVFELKNGLLAVVCDGLGGNKSGDVASKLAVDSIFDYFSKNQNQDNIEKINAAIQFANSELIKLSDENFEHKGMATTVVLLFVTNNKAFWGHVGDSRIYFYKDGKLNQLTKDHSLVQRLLDDGYITDEQAAHHPNRNIIIKALGDKSKLEPDVDYFYLKENETWKFLLCSDGVTSVLNNNEIEEILSENDLNIISSKLSNIIDDKGAPDNYTFVVISNN